MQIKFLKDFYGLSSENSKKFKTHKAGSSIELNSNNNIPLNSFWADQLSLEENKEYFEIINTTITTKKPK